MKNILNKLIFILLLLTSLTYGEELNMKYVLNINHKVNSSVKYANDIDIYKKQDYWELPNKYGDCEDYALLKMNLLSKYCFNCSRMIIFNVENNIQHAVLVVRLNTKEYVLDNRTDNLLFLKDVKYKISFQQDYLYNWYYKDKKVILTQWKDYCSRHNEIIQCTN